MSGYWRMMMTWAAACGMGVSATWGAPAETPAPGATAPAGMAIPTAQPTVAVENADKAKGEDPSPAPTEKETRLPAGVSGYYAILLKELQLEGEAREKFAQAVRERQTAMLAWEKDHKDEMKTLRKQVEDGKTSGNYPVLQAATTRLQVLKTAETQLDQEHDANIQATLTPGQRGHVRCYNMYTGMLRTLGKYDLTEEQKAKVKDICLSHRQEAGKEPYAQDGMRAIVLKEVLEQALTAEQKTAYDADHPVKPVKVEKPASRKRSNKKQP